MTTVIVVVIVVLLLVAALRLWITANRMDRLHVRTEAAWAALEGGLARRIVATRAVAAAGGLDPHRADELRRLADTADTADRQHRADAENDLSRALARMPAVAEPELAAIPIVAVTSPDLALVRFHGRRVETWEAQSIPVVERFRYLYSEEELAEWLPRIREAAEEAREIHILMNNCYANYGSTNARELSAMLEAELGASADAAEAGPSPAGADRSPAGAG